VGFYVHDFFPVNPQHHTENPVGGRVLRPHIEKHLNGFGIGREVGVKFSAVFYHLLSISIACYIDSLAIFGHFPNRKGGSQLNPREM
jgi:hypothetical protein